MVHIRHAIAEYIMLMASFNATRVAFNKNKKSQDHFSEKWLDKIRLACNLVSNNILLVDNLDVFDFFTFNDLRHCVKIIDPPYIHQTRNQNATSIYVSEFNGLDHMKLAHTLETYHNWILCGKLPENPDDNPYQLLDNLENVIHALMMS